MKLTDTVLTVNQKTAEVTKTNRAYVLNIALIEMRLLGLVTQAQEDSVGAKLDKMFLKNKSELGK